MKLYLGGYQYTLDGKNSRVMSMKRHSETKICVCGTEHTNPIYCCRHCSSRGTVGIRAFKYKELHRLKQELKKEV